MSTYWLTEVFVVFEMVPSRWNDNPHKLSRIIPKYIIFLNLFEYILKNELIINTIILFTWLQHEHNDVNLKKNVIFVKYIKLPIKKVAIY